MDSDLPLDINEFHCTPVKPSHVVVVFAPTRRTYTYTWHSGDLRLSEPVIEGSCDPHPVEVIDCLARAVGYKAARKAFSAKAVDAGEAEPVHRSRAVQLRNFLTMRTVGQALTRMPRF